jgi:hypothetical protein
MVRCHSQQVGATPQLLYTSAAPVDVCPDIEIDAMSKCPILV